MVDRPLFRQLDFPTRRPTNAVGVNSKREDRSQHRVLPTNRTRTKRRRPFVHKPLDISLSDLPYRGVSKLRENVNIQDRSVARERRTLLRWMRREPFFSYIAEAIA
jgi:hypothetical protein